MGEVKASGTVVNDSRVDEFTCDALSDEGMGSEIIAVIVFATDGDGFWFSTPLPRRSKTDSSTTRTCSSSRSSRMGGVRCRSGSL